MKRNEILLRRKNRVMVKKEENELPKSYIATMLKNLEAYGFTFSAELIDIINTLSEKEATEFYKNLVAIVKEMIGGKVKYKPMYPNFPEQVMKADMCELYINAIIHYISSGKILPDYEKEARIPLIDNPKLRVIGLASEDDFMKIFTNLLTSKTSLSQTDKEDIIWFFNKYGKDLLDLIPDEIPLKENAAFVSNLLLKHIEESEEILKKYFKTATDVLRFAVAMCDGDISLAQKPHFKSFKRSERRLLLSLLENCQNIEEDMLRYKGVWIRLGEKLHPTEYKIRYPKVSKAFYKLRNGIKIETFKGNLEKAFQDKDMELVVSLLKQRPGEFGRSLDRVLRLASNKILVVNEFASVANKISSPVLLQVKEHFANRNGEKDIRVFFPKGNIGKAYGMDYNLEGIDETTCQEIVNICEQALIEIYRERETLGKVYIDESLKNYLVPFSQRSASKAFRTLIRGSKIPIDDVTKTIRAFIYWKEAYNDRTDIDLSAVIYDEDWEHIEHISYTNLKSAKYKAYHSGDIIEAPKGASEFIDIDLESIRKFGGRYIVFSINSFTCQPFSKIPECFMGFMNREYPNSGEIYEEKTVQNKIDITANTKICIPMIIDVIENKIIWTDIALTRVPYWCNNVEGNAKGMSLMGKSMTNLVKPNLYDLFKLNAIARGEIVTDEKDADVIFSVNKGITPFDTDEIMAEYI